MKARQRAAQAANGKAGNAQSDAQSESDEAVIEEVEGVMRDLIKQKQQDEESLQLQLALELSQLEVTGEGDATEAGQMELALEISQAKANDGRGSRPTEENGISEVGSDASGS